MSLKQIEQKLFQVSSEQEFNEIALQIFSFQYQNIEAYHQFAKHLGKNPDIVKHYSEIPFLPIAFFKTHSLIAKNHKSQIRFESSGTTGMTRSRHEIYKPEIYENSFLKAFNIFYGDPADYRILALLPSYLESKNSSLVYMVNKLINLSPDSKSGFYLEHTEKLKGLLDKKGSKTILFGVPYALLDMLEKFTFSNPGLIVMETGGMKGRRKEMVREELHDLLRKGFGVDAIHSEYGMTELLSQSYSKGNGLYYSPPWKKILIRDTNDPLSLLGKNKTGGINVIDLANLYSCSFIATEDLGKMHPDGGFEILGRFDSSDIRGCNLLVG